MTKTLAIGLLGYGTVASEVDRILTERRNAIRSASGCDIYVKRALVRGDTSRPVKGSAQLTTNPDEILNDPEIALGVELMGGVDTALNYILRFFKSGRPVVTANKQLLSRKGAQLFEAAEQAGLPLRFEASVAGAIPVIKVLREAMSGAGVCRVTGILNGTTNFILSQMHQSGATYESALEQAQSLGYAEADPSEDVEGTDAAAKTAILASLAFQNRVTLNDVPHEGIAGLDPIDIGYATELGYVTKLISVVELKEEQIFAATFPALIELTHPLAGIGGAHNAVLIEGAETGQILLSGPGAGGHQTASAVVSDIVNVVAGPKAGPFLRCSCAYNRPFTPLSQRSSTFYLRLEVVDQPGVLAAVAGAFAREEVSIRSMIQKGTGQGAELVLVLWPVQEGRFFRALDQVGGLSAMRGAPVALRML